MSDYRPLFYVPTTPWVQSFAWLPVDTTDRGLVWLRRVYKRRIQKKLTLPGPPDQAWQYVCDERVMTDE